MSELTYDPLGSDAPVAEAMTPLVALALDSSDRRESGTGSLEVDRLLRGTSGSLMISLLLPGFVDIFVEMLSQ